MLHHFQNATKAAADFTMYATLATEHAINVIENGASAVCSIQGVISDVSTNYSFISTFAQATVASLATFAYYNPPVLIGACALGAIAISPYDSIKCAENTIKAGIAAGYVACETVKGLMAGAAGIVSLIADNIYGDTAELAGAINTNMIEYYS